MTTKTETLDALRRAEDLLSRCCVLLYTPQVVDHLPGCIAEDLRELMKPNNWLNFAIQNESIKAEVAQ